jgi:TPR repeat protein
MKLLPTTLLVIVVLAHQATVYASSLAAQECQRLYDQALLQEAIALCHQAAQSGERQSQTILGEIYDEDGNSEMTIYWWNRAAEAGYLPARNLLAMKYYYGGTVFGPQDGWDKDYAKAFSIWQEGANQGDAPSQFMLGVMYYNGQGVVQDLVQAWFWLKLALQNNYLLASDVLYELTEKLTPEQQHQAMKKLAAHHN